MVLRPISDTMQFAFAFAFAFALRLKKFADLRLWKLQMWFADLRLWKLNFVCIAQH